MKVWIGFDSQFRISNLEISAYNILYFFTGLEFESQCKGCEPGYYCASYGLQSTEGNCSARYYCSGNASVSSPTDGSTGNKCPVGHYCPEGTSNPIPCVPGTFTDTELNDVCLQCTPGYYCTQGSSPDPCPAGFYCPEGTGHVWQSCPPGTFSSATGLENMTQCTQCTGGYYCSGYNLTSETGQCDAGYYCRSGSDSNQPNGATSTGDAGPCPVGHYCTAQTQEPTDCPAGTFNNGTMLMSVTECQSCLPGYYCDLPGLVYPTGVCNPGFYCAGGSNTSSPPTTDTTGGPCPAGTYCLAGSSKAEDCPAGTYNPVEQQSNCTTCPAGYYCTAGSTNTTLCPQGKRTSKTWML